MRLYFQSKEKRDALYKELTAKGKKLKRGTSGTQYIHPQYVEDFEGPEKFDTGFGNTVYKTYFKQLYILKDAI